MVGGGCGGEVHSWAGSDAGGWTASQDRQAGVHARWSRGSHPLLFSHSRLEASSAQRWGEMAQCPASHCSLACRPRARSALSPGVRSRRAISLIGLEGLGVDGARKGLCRGREARLCREGSSRCQASRALCPVQHRTQAAGHRPDKEAPGQQREQKPFPQA